MKPTAPLRDNLSVFATTPSTSSRFPASLVRLASSRSRTPAVLLFSDSWLISFSLDESSLFRDVSTVRVIACR